MYQCAGCGKFFRSISGFDMHRVGKFEPNERQCMSTSTMIEQGMLITERTDWITKKGNIEALKEAVREKTA